MKRLACLLFLLQTTSVSAQLVYDCDGQAGVDRIPEPWEEHSRTYPGSDVRVAVIDGSKHKGAGQQVIVLSPPYSSDGKRQCKVISLDQGVGFAGVDFGSLSSNYDADDGFVFGLDVQRFTGDTGGVVPGKLHFSVDGETGFIGVILK